MITVPLVQMPGILISALIDETDKQDPANSPGRIDSVTVVLDAGVTVEFVLTNPGGQGRTVAVTGPHNNTYAIPGAANRRRSWGWSIRVVQ